MFTPAFEKFDKEIVNALAHVQGSITEAKSDVLEVSVAEKAYDEALAQYKVAKENFAKTRNDIRVAIQSGIEQKLTEIYNKIIEEYFKPKEGLKKAYIYARETKDFTKQLSLVVVFKSDAKNIGIVNWKKDIETKYGIKVSMNTGGRSETVIQPTKEGLVALNLVSIRLKKKIANIIEPINKNDFPARYYDDGAVLNK